MAFTLITRERANAPILFLCSTEVSHAAMSPSSGSAVATFAGGSPLLDERYHRGGFQRVGERLRCPTEAVSERPWLAAWGGAGRYWVALSALIRFVQLALTVVRSIQQRTLRIRGRPHGAKARLLKNRTAGADMHKLMTAGLMNLHAKAQRSADNSPTSSVPSSPQLP